MLRRSCARLLNAGCSPQGRVHPDVAWGNWQAAYRGPGWCGWHKLLPMEALMVQGGSSCTNVNDRVGVIVDPEDPRHPLCTYLGGGHTHHDGTVMAVTEGNNFEPISGGSRLLQVLYDTYLEPFSMHRVPAILGDHDACPNHLPEFLLENITSMGETSSIIGNVIFCTGSTCGEGVTIKADVNDVYIQESVQIMDNVCIVTDRPTNLNAYQRHEELNPYQDYAPMEGTVVIRHHSVIEPNVFLDSCQIGSFNRIGHGARIMKGVTSGNFVHVLPGSVVLAGTRMETGELWGGAPARKLGAVAKFEFKRVFGRSRLIYDFANAGLSGVSRWGDQHVQRMVRNQQLDALMVSYEDGVTPAVQARIEQFIEGKEPWHHKITRLTQGWTPSVRGDDKNTMMCPPLGYVNTYATHNCDSYDSQWHGSGINITNYASEFLW